MCLAPITLKTEGYRTFDGRMTNVVPCGKCPECLKRRSGAWAFRLAQENKVSTSSNFLTLTYENPPLTQNGLATLEGRDHQNFMKRLRKAHPKIHYVKSNGKSAYKSPLKYYAVGEYGERTQRPHFHSILFNLEPEFDNQIQEIWQHGHVHIGKVQDASIRYVTNYIMKGTFKPQDCTETGLIDDRKRETAFMSKGLGKDYLSEQIKAFYNENKLGALMLEEGKLMAMPKYYKQKIFDKKELNELRKKYDEIRETEFKDTIEDQEYYRIQVETYHNKIRKDKKDQFLTRNKI